MNNFPCDPDPSSGCWHRLKQFGLQRDGEVACHRDKYCADVVKGGRPVQNEQSDMEKSKIDGDSRESNQTIVESLLNQGL